MNRCAYMKNADVAWNPLHQFWEDSMRGKRSSLKHYWNAELLIFTPTKENQLVQLTNVLSTRMPRSHIPTPRKHAGEFLRMEKCHCSMYTWSLQCGHMIFIFCSQLRDPCTGWCGETVGSSLSGRGSILCERLPNRADFHIPYGQAAEKRGRFIGAVWTQCQWLVSQEKKRGFELPMPRMRRMW